MISILVTSKDKGERESHALAICKDQNIHELDITLFDRETLERKEKKPALSIGIEDVRNLYSKLFLKPFKSSMKAVIIKDAQFLTTEAQNALLKVLEEPPTHTVLILTVDSKESLLPTILSRCKLIALESQQPVGEKDVQEFTQILQMLQVITIPDALKLAETVSKDKDKSLAWLEKLILVSRETLLTNISDTASTAYYTNLLYSLQQTHKLLKTTNVNTRLALEDLFLSQLNSITT